MKFKDVILTHIEEMKEVLELSKNAMEKNTITAEVVYKNLDKILKKTEQIESIVKREN